MTDIEQMIRAIVRAELCRLLDVEEGDLPEDDADLRQLAKERAARLRSKAGGR